VEGGGRRGRAPRRQAGELGAVVGGRSERCESADVHLGRVLGSLAGPDRGATALRPAEDDGLAPAGGRLEVLGGEDRVEHVAKLRLGDGVGLRARGPEPGVVGGHHRVALVDEPVQCRNPGVLLVGALEGEVVDESAGGVRHPRRSAVVRRALGAVRPREDRASRARRASLRDDQEAGADAPLALAKLGEVEDPPGPGPLRRLGDGTGPDQVAVLALGKGLGRLVEGGPPGSEGNVACAGRGGLRRRQRRHRRDDQAQRNRPDSDPPYPHAALLRTLR
jgi:hypothetical protein